MKIIMLAFMMWICCVSARSQSFGVVSEVFPIAEMSFLDFIHERLQSLVESGEFDGINQRWQRRVEAHANRPSPLNLPRTINKQVHYFRPEMVIDMDIKDAQGQVIYSRGTKVNALHQLPVYSPCWLFFNGDEKAEQQWVQKAMCACSNPKIILTGGSVQEMEVFLNAVIYFDQGGVLTQKLGIHATPAKVTRGKLENADALQIEELAVKENGDVL